MTPTNSADARAGTVQAAYDELGPRFGDSMARIAGEPLDRFLGELVARLDEVPGYSSSGCGDGRTTKRLAERFEVVGVDLSEEQLRLARASVPGAGWAAETNGRLVREAGLEVLVDEVIPMWEPDSEYETAFLWVFARKTG
jgi:trans-aconitate methyltransferase